MAKKVRVIAILQKQESFWVATPMCPQHKPISEHMGYLKWHDEAERREKKGMKQKQCHVCKRWFWKDEF